MKTERPATVFLLLTLFAACGGGDDAVGPGTGRLTTSIIVPALIDIPDGGTVAATFVATSQGPVLSETWFVRPVTYADEAPWQELGTGGDLEHTFVDMGTYEVRVVVRSQVDGGIGAIDLDTTVVFPAALRDAEPMAFANVVVGSGAFDPSIWLLDLATLSAPLVLPAPERAISGSTLSWDPAHRRLALAKRIQGGLSNIHVLDLASLSLTRIEGSHGLSLPMDWNPTKDWIAYLDDTVIADSPGSVLVLVRPDGSEQIFPYGETPNALFRGGFLAWSPDGARLAISGDRRVLGTSGDRILIFSFDDLLAGAFRWEPLHTEQQLQGALANSGEGGAGLTWSPDGALIAYGAFNVAPEVRIVIAPADGSGEINVLPYDTARNPTWSPDGRFLAFQKHVGPFVESHLFLVDAQGRHPIDLSRLRLPGQNPDDLFPAW